MKKIPDKHLARDNGVCQTWDVTAYMHEMMSLAIITSIINTHRMLKSISVFED